jgi:hypothetical protein
MVTYTIIVIATANGVVNPSGPVTVTSGANQAFTFTPSSGYYLKTLLIDNVVVTPISSYTFVNVVTNHDVVAVFEVANVYCLKQDIKDRMLIDSTDTSYDAALDDSINEASRIVDVFIKPYATVPLTTYDVNIQQITADFAANVFKRRTIPDEVKVRGSVRPDMMGEVDATGWFALGLRKLEKYIHSYYVMAQAIGNSTHNPDIFSKLFKDGIINGKEARAFINDVTTIVNTEIDSITKTLITTKTDTVNLTKTVVDTETLTKNIDVAELKDITLTERNVLDSNKNLSETNIKSNLESDIKDITETKYLTKRQKSFGFISADPDTEGYKVDSEVD